MWLSHQSGTDTSSLVDKILKVLSPRGPAQPLKPRDCVPGERERERERAPTQTRVEIALIRPYTGPVPWTSIQGHWVPRICLFLEAFRALASPPPPPVGGGGEWFKKRQMRHVRPHRVCRRGGVIFCPCGSSQNECAQPSCLAVVSNDFSFYCGPRESLTFPPWNLEVDRRASFTDDLHWLIWPEWQRISFKQSAKLAIEN